MKELSTELENCLNIITLCFCCIRNIVTDSKGRSELMDVVRCCDKYIFFIVLIDFLSETIFSVNIYIIKMAKPSPFSGSMSSFSPDLVFVSSTLISNNQHGKLFGLHI